MKEEVADARCGRKRELALKLRKRETCRRNWFAEGLPTSCRAPYGVLQKCPLRNVGRRWPNLSSVQMIVLGTGYVDCLKVRERVFWLDGGSCCSRDTRGVVKLAPTWTLCTLQSRLRHNGAAGKR